MIPINENTILEYLDLEQSKFFAECILKLLPLMKIIVLKLITILKSSMNHNHKIQVNFKSIGYGSNDTKEITGTIKLNINEDLIGSI